MQDTLELPSSSLLRAESAKPISARPPACAGGIFSGARRILLPFDFSRPGVCALRAVAEYAEEAKAAVHLLHVVGPDTPQSANAGDDRLAEASERMLKHWVNRVVGGRVSTFASVRIGDTVDFIATRAIAARADLIVMTTRSSSGLKNELQRSTAERVSRLAPCPVLTIPEKCAEAIAYPQSETGQEFSGPRDATILLAVDFSAAAEHALRRAAAIAEATGSKLLLAHGTETEEGEEPAVHDRLRAWAEGILNESVPCDTAVWPGGHSLFAILSEAVRSEASLIVLPTRRHSWARRLRAGSITDGVLRQAPCPVLSINDSNISAEG